MKVIALIALCALGVSITYIAIAESGAPGQSIGIVDVEKVLADYTKAKQANAELKTLENKLKGQLNYMTGHRLLNDKEITELFQLQSKAKLTKPEETRIAALEDLNTQREAKLRTLQNEPKPTAQQKQELAELQGFANEAGKAIQQAQKDYLKQISDRNGQLTADLGKDIKGAVAIVSQEANTPIVINKTIVIQGGTDLTEKTITKLNGK